MVNPGESIQFVGGNGDGRRVPMTTFNRTLPANLMFMGSTYGYDPVDHTYRAVKAASEQHSTQTA